MADQRKRRDLESRKAESRPSDSWVQPSELPMPNPVDGWKFRYIRTASLGQADVRNVSKKFREGWVPVVANECPELEIMSDVGSAYPDSVEVGGLLLCKMPVEKINQRNTHYDNLNRRQLESVDEGFMNDRDPRMPKYNDSKSRTEFRKG